MKRPVYAGKEPKAENMPADAAGHLKKLAPQLWEFLTHATYDDGEARQTGTFMVLVDDGVLKGWVNDKDCGKACWVSADSWENLLRAAQKALEDPGTAWRAVKDWKTPKKGK